MIETTGGQGPGREAELGQLRLFLEAIFGSVPWGIFLKDTSHRFIAASREIADVMGVRDPAELSGKTDHDFFPSERADEYLADERAVLETKSALIGKVEPKRLAGRERLILVTKRPVLDSNGSVIGLVGFTEDITEQAEVIEALRRTNRELRAVSRCNQVLIRAADEQQMVDEICRIICDEGGYRLAWVGYAEHDEAKSVRPVAWAGGDGEYPRSARITWADTERGRGPSGTAVRTGTIQILQDASDDPRFEPWRANASARGFRSSIALPLKNESSETFGVLNIYAGVSNAFTPDETRLLAELADDLAFGISTLRARAERNRAEEALRKSEERLQHAQKMEAVGRLAGGVAHDFNNLLTVINGCSELLLAGLAQVDPNRELAVQIKRSGERAANLTGQLLAFSRKQVLSPQVVDLNALLDGLRKLLVRLIGEDIELALAADRGIGMARVDPGQFEQLVINLAINARDAMPAGGRLTIETRDIVLSEDWAARNSEVRAGRYVEIVVADTGEGMDEATRARVFEPFFTTKERGKGTGLGLAMVYGFVKQSGGHIELYSEPGNGSTFRVYLPCAEEGAAEAAPIPKREESPSGNETILLVEDEDSLRNLVRMVLQSNGYAVLEARDGSEALEIARRHDGAIDLLLTDLVMPRMSGRRLADLLTPLRPAMLVLFMSGYPDEAVMQHGVLQTGVAFLQKPFSPAALTRKVREVLDRGRPAA